MSNKDMTYKIGIDIGSTTLKIVVVNSVNDVVYKVYKRHKANINKVLSEELKKISTSFSDIDYSIAITGSAGMGVSERVGIPFIQEVIASVAVTKKLYPDVSTLIDLGGEDAKIVFFDNENHPDIRMNGSCAGGTGAFIDQMADLLNISVEEMGNKALQFEKLYVIASRCGVFAKTDVQNLICRNVPVEDISMSIFHTVALQSITSLAKGHDLQAKILCIGGPLTFIPALRKALKNLLQIDDNDLIVPENSEYFSALGCVFYDEYESKSFNLNELIEKLNINDNSQKDTLPVLFENEKDYSTWKVNRNIKKLKIAPLENDKNLNCFLGIDSGSTTTKILAMDENENIIYSYYDANEGNPLKKVLEGLNDFYQKTKEKNIRINLLSSAATGYGEDLIKSALNLDYAIVETMAHLSGAQYVDPNVSFVLDIGGQDIKSIFTNKGVISNIELNEACSSGCGSFLQNFAATMNMDMKEFSSSACLAKYPSDLGSRCTVFMNSKVKQASRQNAELGDIAAGLAYSVVKNCLFKVLKISNLNELGDNIVVQGGTFRNDAVYRALELLSEKNVSSTDYPELMGALGAALYARKMWQQNKKETSFLGLELLPDMDSIETKETQCNGCTNKCSVLRFKFTNGNVSFAGNKCEKIFFNKKSAEAKGFNGFDLKNKILFERENHSSNHSKIKIGIPRVLNMFENYPFWHTLLNECGIEPVLSPESTFEMYQKGVGSVMSDNICFPAKVVHGHIHLLAEQKVDRIFYPMVIKEEKEFDNSNNSFNCPVVSGYPDVIFSAMDPEEKFGIPFDKPVITFSNFKALKKVCFDYLSQFNVDKNVFENAFEKAMRERETLKVKLREEQRTVFEKAVKAGKWVFVVAARPYHADPLIHQKVGQILSDLGIEVFTDDVFITDEKSGFNNLNIISQWSYPNRVVHAAMETAKLPQNVQLIQLNSFGCGPDSFFMEEVTKILKQAGKNHTIIRIDEIASPGSIRLRLRSLIESLKAANITSENKNTDIYKGYGVAYTKEDKKKTILAPWFSDFLSPFIPPIAELAGYELINLPKTNKYSAELGLKYGNNEVCYPSTLVLGDIIAALQSGKYDLNNIVVAITQTGGQCRATNYLAQIKLGLQNAGFSDIPVIVVGTGVYQNDQKAFKIPIAKIIDILIKTLLYADALQQLYSLTVVREKNKGESQQLFDLYINKGVEAVLDNDGKRFPKLLEQAVADFNSLDVNQKKFSKVGLIGEIYVKYNNYGQAYITDWLRSKNMIVVSPPFIDFFMQYFVNSQTNVINGVNRNSMLKQAFNPLMLKYMNMRINTFDKIMRNFRFYHSNESVFMRAEYASEILDLSNQFGEGWCIAAETACYARQGINNVVCVQPFGCIANHVVAKGIARRVKKIYPQMNLLYLDIDGGMAEVNLQNRLHFMLE
ncbi:MAG: acyl-CoA dehydratase activase [Bacteroidales bacterium]|jgi:predicted CoA-substrate-specific enzyme activase|nr:acyl-CoA dehydratase activase [Bacteroidales bacterium]